MRYPFLLIPFIIAFTLSAQEPCNVSLTVTLPTCPDDHDGTITVVLGQVGQFTYAWSHAPLLNGPLASGLFAGAYEVVVSDTSGCISVLDTVVENPTVTALGTMVTTNISCAGNDDGAVMFTVNPGPYTWHWVDDGTLTSTTRTGLGPGNYSVQIDGGPCPSFVTGRLGDPDIIIEGNVDYCPSDPPVLTASLQWGFEPDVYVWSTGDATGVVNVVPGTIGSVQLTAVDTSIGCVVTADVFLTELPSPTVAFSAQDSVCLRVEMLATTTQSTADSLVWRWGTSGFSNVTNPAVLFDEPLWQPISLQGFDSLGCGSLAVKDSVYVRPRIPAIFSAMQVPCTSLVEFDLGSTADSCAFFIGDSLVTHDCSGFQRFDVHRYEHYDLTFYSTKPDRCDDTLAVSIDLRTEPVMFLPNAFTPNGDGFNDTWPGPVDIPTEGFHLQLFDRWGLNVWNTTNTQDKWDGAALPTGLYVYTMRMRDPCESTKEIDRQGFVTLFR